MEVFCGTANLSQALQREGFNAIPVDWKRNRHKAKMKHKMWDLTTETGAKALESLVLDDRVAFVHFALPCGTFSRARERPIPKKMLRLGVPEPKPLRSEVQPLGLDSLQGNDADRVAKANKLVTLVARLVLALERQGKLWSIENPRSSLLWWCPDMIKLKDQTCSHDVCFQACMHGGKRDKWTTWRTNVEQLKPLSVACDGKHQHLPWGVMVESGRLAGFATAAEAEYPEELCNKVGKIIKACCLVRGRVFLEKCTKQKAGEGNTEADYKANLRDKRARTGVQARSGTAPLVPEFKSTFTFRCTQKEAEEQELKKGAKLSSIHKYAGTVLEITPTENYMGENGSDQDKLGGEVLIKVGLPWTPEEFTEEAGRLQHPFDLQCKPGDRVLKCIFDILTQGAHKTAAWRAEQLDRWRSRARELEEQEEKIKKQDPPRHRETLKGQAPFYF